MKKNYIFILLIMLAINSIAQVPGAFKYQAVLRDGSGEIRADESVSVEVSILQGSSTGSTVYSESHDVTTNSFGLINLNIGMGSSGDDFGAIDWGDGPYFIKISVDGTAMGTSQLLSVPYAHFADSSASGFSGNYEDLSNTPDLSDTANYLTEETDPLFGESVAQGITELDTAIWNKSKGKWSLKENDTLYYDKGIVGIGTNKPTSNLTVYGSGKSHDVLIKDYNGFLGIDGSGSNTGIQFLNDGTWRTTIYTNPSSGLLQIYNSGAGVGLGLNASNYLGIKTTNPQSELHVNGEVRVDETTSSPEPKTIYGNSFPLAYGVITSGGMVYSGSGYGISSVSRTSTGVYSITLTNGWSGNPVVMATSYNSAPNDEIVTYAASADDNVITINVANGSGTAFSSAFSFIVFGTPQ
jgi:hypothetical protein